MKKLLGIVVLFLLLSFNAYSSEYSSLFKKSKTKNSDKLLKVLDETILGLEFEKGIVQMCYDAIKVINGEEKKKTINEIKKWSLKTGYNLEFIIAKKEKSIYNL